MIAEPIIYAPRMAARLYVAELGLPAQREAQAHIEDVYPIELHPTHARIVSNNYREADELELTVTFDQAGLDPRYLRSAEVYFWLDNFEDVEQGYSFDATNFRFVGIVKDVAREFSATSKVVTFRALDYTTLFLESKPFPQKRLPAYSDTLRQAWQKVCRWTGHFDFTTNPPSLISSVCDTDSSEGAFDGEPRIDLVVWQDPENSISLDTPIGNVINARQAALANIQAQTGTDSWSVWVKCCECQGLVTFIRGNQCIVTTGTEFLTADNPPYFVYGQNVLELTERRDLGQVSGRNVCLRSYDGLKGTTLESFFPGADDPIALKITKKKVKPSAGAGRHPTAANTQDYEILDCQLPITDQATLNKACEMIWIDRMRKELSGTLLTKEIMLASWLPDTGQATPTRSFNLLDLQSGDNIWIDITDTALDNILSLPSDEAKEAALVAQGYTASMAHFITQNISSLTGPQALSSRFLVHSVETEVDVETKSFQMKVEFVNTLDLTGSAALQRNDDAPITGTDHPPVEASPPLQFEETLIMGIVPPTPEQEAALSAAIQHAILSGS